MARDKKDLKLLKRWKIVSKSNNITEIDNVEEIPKKERKQFSSIEVIGLLIITSIVSLILGFTINGGMNTKYSVSIEKFITDFKNIVDNYYDELNEDELLKKALETVINELDDPYSTVVDDSLSNSLNTQLQGSYSGFGIEIVNTENNEILIVGIIKDSPASKSTLKLGDVIIKMDGKDISKMTTTEFSTTVRLSNKQEITLTVIRDSKEEEITIKREIVTLQSVSSNLIEKDNKKIGYVYISLFAANTHLQFIDAVNKLEDQNIDSLIIDVRDNSGGHLTAVEEILNYMLDKTHIIYQLQTKESIEKVYSTGKVSKKYPVSMLINGNSASGSELLAIALQEELGAILVGTTSFGKGTVQEVQSTENTNIEYKLTTKKWLSPKGNWIHKTGIKPDIEIELSENYFNNPSDDNDNQLQKAIESLIK